MAPVIRVDDEVWSWLKSHARPLEDTPNSVLRRLAGLDGQAAMQPSARLAPSGEPPSQSGRRKKGHQNAQLLLEQFSDRLSELLRGQRGRVATWRGGQRASRNVLEVTTQRGPLLLYVKVSDALGFWGLNPNQLRALRAAGRPWAVVLLLGPGEDAYMLDAATVANAVDTKRWSTSQQGEFKVTVGTSLRDARQFSTYTPLFDALLQLGTPHAA